MKLGMAEALSACTKRLQEVTGLPLATAVSAEPGETGWHLQVELVEKESIPRGMDILGLYDVWLDDEGTLLRFARRSTRRRVDVSAEL